jgi:hypothetical protein
VVKVALVATAALLVACIVPTARAMTASGEASTSRTLVNTARRDAAVSVLPADERLQRIAQEQSERMAAQGSIFHNTHLGEAVTSAGIDWRWVGENVGVGPDAKLIHDGFMHSPHHYEVLMHADANAFGIGAVVGKDGRLYITQVYAKEVSARPPVAAPAPTRTAPRPTAASPPPARRTIVARSDPNALIHGVVPRDTFAVTLTRSGLRAS